MIHKSARRTFLVIVRAGDESRHHDWLEQDPERNWDLLVSSFGDSEPTFEDYEITYQKGPKWPVLATLVRARRESLRPYRLVFFPDDDLAFPPGGITAFLREATIHNLVLSQPSLTRDSFVSHSITVQNESARVRFTEWVEIMCPCFSQEALDLCESTFDANVSGWGICLLWPVLLKNKGRIGIVDATPVRHTRPFFGPNYKHLSERNISPMQEMRAIITSHGLPEPDICNMGAIDQQGRHLTKEDMDADNGTWLVAPW